MRSQALRVQYWTREGFFYVSRILGQDFTIERKLDFISYHLISWIHGEEVLKEMASKLPERFQ